MGKFNKIPDVARELYEREDAIVNYEGALAFKLDPYTELYIRAASTLVGEPKYYTSAKESDSDLLQSIRKMATIDPKFILQLAIYCRENLYLRSVPLLLVAEFANDKNCIGKVENARRYVKKVIQRADELTELVAYQLARNGAISRKTLLFRWGDESAIDVLTKLIKRKFGIDLEYSEFEKFGDAIEFKLVGRPVLVKLNSTKTKANIIINGEKVDDLPIVAKDGDLNVYDETKLPMLIRFGVGLAFPKFDRYQIGKYDRKDRKVKMRDAMFLTHPTPIGIEQEDIYRKLAEGTLESPETWEVMRSTGKMTWHDVIRDIFYKDHKIRNYMAILKNLRNCLTDDSVTGEDIELLCRMISDRNAVKYSKQLPFRYLSAYKELSKAAGKNTGEGDSIFSRLSRRDSGDEEKLTPVGMMHVGNLLDAVDIAASYGADNFPKLEGNTVIACDVSGSMENKISSKSSVERYDIGIILGMTAHQFCQRSLTGMFGDEWKVFPMSKNAGVLKNAISMKSHRNSVGLSTNGYRVIRYLDTNNIQADRIMIFTDNQMWDNTGENETFSETFIRYKRKFPRVKLYSFDLSGYGNISIPQDTKDVCLIGGWSDRIFDFVQVFENLGDSNTAINKIKEISP